MSTTNSVPEAPKLLIHRLRDALGEGGTRETTPRHIWMHNVEVAASRELRGGSGDELRDPSIRERLVRAYNAGEPMYFAAYSAVRFAEGHRISAREDAERATIHRARIRGAYGGK